MNNKTDRYFRDRLENFGQAPPESAWDQILSKLENRKRRKAMLIFFRIAAGMAILMSTGLGIYLINNNQGMSKKANLSQSPVNNELNSKITSSEKSESTNVPKNEPEKYASEEASIAPEDNERPDPNFSILANREETKQVAPADIMSQNDIAVEENRGEPVLANITPSTILLSDSTAKEINLPRQMVDSGITPAQAAEILLAQVNIPEVTENKSGRRWSVGSEIAPLYSDRNISSPSFSSEESNMNSNESGILAYAGGIRIALNTGKRLSVQSGIYYSRYGQQINQVETVATNEIDENNYAFIAASNSTGNIEGIINTRAQSEMQSDPQGFIYSADYKTGVTNSEVKPLVQGDAQNIQLKQYFDYFELPLILRYKFIDRKLDFSFSGGLITNFLVGNSVNMIADGKSTYIGGTSDINEVNYLGSVGMGLEVPVAANLTFTAEPRFRYYINPIDRTSGITVHPYSFGFFAGINYRF